MREIILAICGALGAAAAAMFGGWSAAMTTLLIVMGIDYLSGIVVAGIFHASKHTEGGGLESLAGWKGLCRKGMTLLIVFIAARIDIMLGSTYFKDGTAIAFCVNELLSIIENAGLMGLPIPEIVTRAIEVLKAGEETKVS